MDKARKAALNALDSVLGDGAYSNITLDKIFKSFDLSSVDKGFASALTYGVLDRKITLDYILSSYIKKGFDKTPITVLNALRMALYQIEFMDKVPESAAVNESVNLIKHSKFKYSAAFVNGVLRNILRNGISIPEDDSVQSLSVRYSCPQYIVEEFIKDYGTETAVKLLEYSLKSPAVYLKVNTCKTTTDELIKALAADGINAKPCALKNAVCVTGGIDVTNSRAYKEGLFHAEDLACQTAVKALSVKAGERVLDMCSAPGGKAFSMAEDMENTGEIICCDIYESRTELIKRGAERLSLSVIKPTVVKPRDYGDMGMFDAILCDVPCSGFGVLGRKPEIKYKRDKDYDSLTDIQFNILSCADKYLKAGGRLMYSTCTLRKAENGGVVSRFLEKYQGYTVEKEHTFLPHIDGTDGFYYCLLKKSR